VVDLLLEHLDSDKLGPLGASLGYLDRMVDADYSKAVAERIERHGKNVQLLGWLAYQRNEKTLRSEPPKSDAYLAAKASVAAAVEKAGDKWLKSQFDELVIEVEKFGIGMKAPEITGVDLDGVAFKLSDYQGKVVFLDFWGDW
jgi:hydrogenase maturation factor HypE